MNFGYLVLLLLQKFLLLLLLVPGWENTIAVKDREAPKLAPKIPNVTSETHRNDDFGYLFLLLLQRLLLLLLLVPGWGNTMAVKDGEAPTLHPKMPNVISETYRKK